AAFGCFARITAGNRGPPARRRIGGVDRQAPGLLPANGLSRSGSCAKRSLATDGGSFMTILSSRSGQDSSWVRREAVIERFEAAWRQGEPDLAEFLPPGDTPGRRQLLLQI